MNRHERRTANDEGVTQKGIALHWLVGFVMEIEGSYYNPPAELGDAFVLLAELRPAAGRAHGGALMAKSIATEPATDRVPVAGGAICPRCGEQRFRRPEGW